jgi:hypothetical protein
MLCVSIDGHRVLFSIGGEPSQTIFSTILQNERYRFRETRSSFVAGTTLPVCAGNLRAIRDVPVPILLNDRRKLVFHALPPLNGYTGEIYRVSTRPA